MVDNIRFSKDPAKCVMQENLNKSRIKVELTKQHRGHKFFCAYRQLDNNNIRERDTGGCVSYFRSTDGPVSLGKKTANTKNRNRKYNNKDLCR